MKAGAGRFFDHFFGPHAPQAARIWQFLPSVRPVSAIFAKFDCARQPILDTLPPPILAVLFLAGAAKPRASTGLGLDGGPGRPIARLFEDFSMSRLVFSLALAAVLAVAGVVPVRAGSPWKRISLFKKIEANPEKSYPLSEKEGPWIIMCATFSGEQAEEQARELVQELRSRHKLEAYTHAVEFDHLKDTQTGRVDRFGRQQKMQYRMAKTHEIAVVVGSYNAADDRAAQSTLKRIKYLSPDCLDVQKRLANGKKENRVLSGYRTIQKYAQELANSSKKDRGPMGHAFITTNPLIPDDYFVPKGLDDLVVQMNKHAEFSLLECPGQYTVVVAVFTGAVVLDQNMILDIEKERKNLPSMLEEAAEKAHRLASALREKGVAAYEFHDRHSSLVTVGEFDAYGSRLADGSFALDPKIQAVIGAYQAEENRNVPAGQQAAVLPKTLDGIPFSIKPYVVEVPRPAR